MDWFDSPYLHTVGVGYFPDDLYAEMLKTLPPDGAYRASLHYPLRSVFDVHKGFWGGVGERVTQGEKARVQLVRDFPGYKLGPHTDSPTDVKTLLFYLTPVPRESGGTSVFRSKRPCDGRVHHEFKDFELVKTAPYVPNGFYGHVRSDYSFHGVFPVNFVRNTLAVTFYEP